MKFMKLFFTILCAFLLGGVYGQENNTLLWKIDGNGLETPSYLFGTIHVKCVEDISLSKKC